MARIERSDDGCLIAWVRRRPDLDTSAGADECELMCSAILDAGTDTDALVLELSAAPPVTGPRTQATLGNMLRTWVRGRRRAAIVAGPSAVQRMQLDRIVADVRSADVIVTGSLEAARAFLRVG